MKRETSASDQGSVVPEPTTNVKTQPPNQQSEHNAGLAQVDYLQKVGIAIAGLLTVVEQLWLAIEKDWQLITFPRRTVNIAKLCGGPTAASEMTDFVDDARRLALAVVASDLFAGQDYEGAKRAISEARSGMDSSGCDKVARSSPCRGVLAFYLASLDLGLGNFGDAETEYRYAADHLESAAPLISLGELYMRLGRQREAFTYLDRAVQSDPTSVAALATRASYERDYLRPYESMLDLDRALRLPATHPYDLSTLSRALYQRGGKGDVDCGIAMLGRLVSRPDFDRRTMLDTFVRYGIWLTSAKRRGEAVNVLRGALDIDPYNVKANYWMGIAMKKDGPAPEATAFFRRALLAPSFTDEDFLLRGDAATELSRSATTPADRKDVQKAANAAYGQALQLNHRAVYARLNRGILEDQLKDFNAANADLRAAADLHPTDHYVLSTYASFLRRQGRTNEAQRYSTQTRKVEASRIPADDAQQWSSATCSYADIDAF